VDGLDVLRQIKANVQTRMIPVVMLTSSHLENDILTSYQLGVNSYLVKAVEFERYSEELRSLGHYWLLLNKTPPL
jgi:two-component system response regulator